MMVRLSEAGTAKVRLSGASTGNVLGSAAATSKINRGTIYKTLSVNPSGALPPIGVDPIGYDPILITVPVSL
jgi:hypothetical protein